MRALTLAVAILAAACSPQVPKVTVEVTGTPTKSWLDVAAQCMGVPVDWSVSENSTEPNVGRIEVPAPTFDDREARVVQCLREQPGVTDVRVRR